MAEETKKKKSFLLNSRLFQRFKSIKHIELIVIAVFFAILLLIYFSSSGGSVANSASGGGKVEASYASVGDYVSSLEDKLKTVLSQIQGAGKVSVMVTVDGGIEFVYGERTEEKSNTNSSGSYTTTSTTKTSTPDRNVIVKQILPPVSGVLVVATGAGDMNVRLKILTAIQSILSVKASSIEVICGI